MMDRIDEFATGAMVIGLDEKRKIENGRADGRASGNAVGAPSGVLERLTKPLKHKDHKDHKENTALCVGGSEQGDQRAKTLQPMAWSTRCVESKKH